MSDSVDIDAMDDRDARARGRFYDWLIARGHTLACASRMAGNSARCRCRVGREAIARLTERGLLGGER